MEALASVVDVYDLASEIGKEFERLIDAHGADSLTNMMPKVPCPAPVCPFSVRR